MSIGQRGRAGKCLISLAFMDVGTIVACALCKVSVCCKVLIYKGIIPFAQSDLIDT